MSRARLALALVGAVAACRGRHPTVHRTGSAAPVEMVTPAQLADAAAAGTVVEEVEPNDSDEIATPLALPGKARGKIEPESDVDRYRLDITRPGVLQVQLPPVDMDLVLELEDGAGEVVARSARGGTRVAEGIPNFGVTPGRYTLVVRAAPRHRAPVRRGRHPAPEPKAPPAPVYELSAQLVVPPAGAEHEPDDDRGTANDLLPQDSVTGYIGWSGDEDWWKLSTEALAANNAVELAVAPVEGVAITLEVTDALGQPLLVRKGARGDGVSVHNLVPAIAPGAPPFVYAVVSGDRSNPETAYQLHAAAWVPNPDEEAEPDDTPDHPHVIPPDRTVVHAWWEYGDTDCFAVAPTAQARQLEVTVDTPAELDLAAELFVDGASVAKSDHPGKGVPEKLSAPVAGNGKAVACVRAGREGPPRTKIAYDVHVQESGVPVDAGP